MTDSTGTAPTPNVTTGSAGPQGDVSGLPRTRQRLYVPWWGWPPALGAAVLLGVQIHMGYPGPRAWIPYVVLATVMVAVLVWLGRARVEVGGGDLVVGPARIPTRFVGEVEVVDKADKGRALGRELDPAAYVVHRAWVGPMVWVEITDPQDPTPYWLFSARRPEEVRDALLAEKEASADA
ncbi:DUF3093 domain-containing protein [Actinoalloteichus sp. AHMU CJ021]|uniref:DUF3093 domain-containing protein n=1 Tax=Actinoalloteichus sp. AHMU CJ021 TaxID=2072503 RepID=UPI000CA08A50|nr:DUF3093 domain-containing protein [Actinoalloteichus sp. AHMU CJ021]